MDTNVATNNETTGKEEKTVVDDQLPVLNQPLATTFSGTSDTTVFADKNNFEHAQRVAKMLCTSSLVPKEYQNNIQNTMIALEMANRIGASPLMVMQNLYIVQGKPGWSSSFIIAALNSCRRFSPLRFEMSGEGDEYGCEAWAYDVATKDKLLGPKVTMAMVKAEGWLTKTGSKWKTMPELMFRYRAAAFFGRLYAPDVMMGMHTAEEVQDIVQAVIPEESPELLDAISQMRTAVNVQEFTDIKTAFPGLSDDIDFQKNLLYYQRKNIKP